MKQLSNNAISYKAGHPWYYRLGGRILFPLEIKAKVNISDYPDFMIEDILAAAKMAEPKRSDRLRPIKLKIRDDIQRDLNRYLECVRELKARRLDPNPKGQSIVSCVYMG